jgi:hypothetical protein
MSTEITGFFMVMALAFATLIIAHTKNAIASSRDVGNYSKNELCPDSNAVDIISLPRNGTQNIITGSYKKI